MIDQLHQALLNADLVANHAYPGLLTVLASCLQFSVYMRRLHWWSIPSAMVLALYGFDAHCQMASEPAPPTAPANPAWIVQSKPPRRSRGLWYGGEMLEYGMPAAGVAALGMGLLVFETHQYEPWGGAMLVSGLGVYVLSGPIIHVSHNNTYLAYASFGMRLGAPFLGAAGGAIMNFALTQRGPLFCEDNCKPGQYKTGTLIGFSVGLVAALAVDSAALAYEKNSEYGSANLIIIPTLDPHNKMAGMNILSTW